MSFGVLWALLNTCYDSVVTSAMFYGAVCWSSGLSVAERKRLDKLIRKASSVTGCPLDSMQEVGNKRILTTLTSLLDNVSHPMHEAVA